MQHTLLLMVALVFLLDMVSTIMCDYSKPHFQQDNCCNVNADDCGKSTIDSDVIKLCYVVIMALKIKH